MRKQVQALMTVASLAATGQTAYAQERPDTIGRAVAYVSRECPVTPDSALKGEKSAGRLEFLGPVGLIIGAVAGKLVESGVNAIGDALEQASREQGFGVEGSGWYYSTALVGRSGGVKLAKTTIEPACLVIFSQDDKGAGIDSFPTLLTGEKPLVDALRPLGVGPLIAEKSDDGSLLYPEYVAEMKRRGATREPPIYIEARILTGKEGIVIRPVYIRYARALPGAPKAASEAELHITLATPGASDIGTAFAAARLRLPKIAPGQTLVWSDLLQSSSPMLASRPTAGTVDTALTEANATYAAEATRKRETIVAERAEIVAKRRLSAKPGDAALLEAHEVSEQALADAKRVQEEAEHAAGRVEGRLVGATNVKARFVVIRAPDKFGLALAKALKSQAEAAGKATTEAFAPKPEWTANDTAYLAAEAALAGKQREYDAALAAGDAATSAKLLGELDVAKAKVNEAAVAIKRPIPYPGLL